MNKEQLDREAFEAAFRAEFGWDLQDCRNLRGGIEKGAEWAWQARTPEIEALRAEVDRLKKLLRKAGDVFELGPNGTSWAYSGCGEIRREVMAEIDASLAQADSIKADDAYTIGSNRYEIEPIGSKAKGE